MASDETHRDHRQNSGPEELKNAMQDQARAKELEIKELRDEIRELRDGIRELRDGIRELGDQIKAKDQEMRGVENEIASASETKVREPLEAKLRFLRREINCCNGWISSREQQIINLQREIESRDQEVISLQQDIRSLRHVQAGPASGANLFTYFERVLGERNRLRAELGHLLHELPTEVGRVFRAILNEGKSRDIRSNIREEDGISDEVDDSPDNCASRPAEEMMLEVTRGGTSKRQKFSLPEMKKLEDLVGILPDDELQQDRVEIAMKHLLQIPVIRSMWSDVYGSLPPSGMYA